jgi:hypothetical protein
MTNGRDLLQMMNVQIVEGNRPKIFNIYSRDKQYLSPRCERQMEIPVAAI